MSENDQTVRVKVLYHPSQPPLNILQGYDIVLVQSGGAVTESVPYEGAEWGIPVAYLREGAPMPLETRVYCRNRDVLERVWKCLPQELAISVPHREMHFRILAEAEQLLQSFRSTFSVEVD